MISFTKSADRESPKILSIDASENENSFALVIGHNVEDPDTGKRKTIIDGMFEVIPSKNKPCSYPDIYDEVIVPICQELNVGLTIIDRYPGGIQMVQQLDRDLGIPGIKRSAKYSDYAYFRQALFNGLVDIPKLEIPYEDAKKLADGGNYPFCFEKRPVAHMLIQALTIEDILGRKVDKGEGFTDDLFYAAVNLYAACNNDDLADQFLGEQPEDEVNNQQFIGSVGGEGLPSKSISVYGGDRVDSNGPRREGGNMTIGVVG